MVESCSRHTLAVDFASEVLEHLVQVTVCSIIRVGTAIMVCVCVCVSQKLYFRMRVVRLV